MNSETFTNMSESPKTGTNQWADGSDFSIEGKLLRITRKLGEGATALVYRGTFSGYEVAVKVMRVGVGESIRSLFLSEGSTINEIHDQWDKPLEEEKLDPKFTPPPQVVPAIYWREDKGVEPFLVMEFMQGRTVEETLKEGPLEEARALEVASQFGRLLRVLHEGMKKHYADLKFDNLWILDRAGKNGQPLLKVIDWNILSEYTPERAQRDLFFATLYLYQMLTGTKLPYNGTRVLARPDKQPAWEKLTTGTRRFLLRALNPYANQRFSSAQQWQLEVSRLAQWWRQDARQLTNEAAQEMDRAVKFKNEDRSNEALACFNKASDLLSVSDQKGRGIPAIWMMLNEKVIAGIQATSNLETGLRLLQSHEFSEAMKTLLHGAQNSIGNPQPLLRWYWLASAGLAMGKYVFDRFANDDEPSKNNLIGAVQRLLAGNTLEAERMLSEAWDSLLGALDEKHSQEPFAGLVALRDEARVYNLAAAAQVAQSLGKYDECVEKWKEAAELWKGLPQTTPTVWAEELGDVWKNYGDALGEQYTIGLARQLREAAVDLVNNKSYAAAAVKFSEALYHVDSDLETLDAWRKAAWECLGQGDEDGASKLAVKAMLNAQAKDYFIPIIVILGELQHMRGLLNQNQTEAVIAGLEAYCNAHSSQPEAFGPGFARLVRETGVKAGIQKKWDEFDKILPAVVIGHVTGYEDSIKEIREFYNTAHVQQKMDEVYRRKRAIDALLIDKPEGWLDKAKDQWNILLKSVSGDFSEKAPELQYTHANIAAALREREEAIEEEKRAQAALKAENDQKIASWDKKLAEIDAELQKVGEPPDVALPRDSEEAVLEQKKQVERVQLSCEALKTLEEWEAALPFEASALAERKARYARYLENSPKEVIADAMQRLQARLNILEPSAPEPETPVEIPPPNPDLAALEQAYRAGPVAEFESLLDREEQRCGCLESLAAYRQKLNTICQFIEWVNRKDWTLNRASTETNSTLIELNGWLDQQVPTIYWQQAGLVVRVQPYAITIQQLLSRFQRTRRRKDKQEDASSEQLLAELIAADRLLRRLKCASGQPVPPPDPNLTARDLAGAVLALLETPQKKSEAAVHHLLETVYKYPENAPAGQDAIINAEQQVTAERAEARRDKIYNFLLPLVTAVGWVGLIALIAWTLASRPPTSVTPTAGPVVTQTATSVGAPTITPTLEATATPTQPPTPTLGPTPLSTSAFTLSELPVMPVPLGGQPLFLLDNRSVELTGPQGYWKSSQAYPPAIGGDWFYTDAPVKEDASATWKMDQPLAEVGRYEIFVSDTQKNSYSAKPIKYLVGTLSADGQFQEQAPVLGSPEVKLQSSATQIDGMVWASLGVYQLPAGSQVAVRVNVKDLPLDANNQVGIDGLLISRLPALPPSETVPLLNNLPDGLSADAIAFWADDSQATLSPAEGWNIIEANPGNWLGDRSLAYPLADPKAAPSITWSIDHPLFVGKYKVYAFVSPEIKGLAVYEFWFNGAKSWVVKDFPIDPESGIRGTSVLIGEVEIAAGQPNMLSVVLKPQKESKEGVLAGSVIYLVKEQSAPAENQ